ncbi:hypothetical protein F5B20DRAFT_337598 [Whalleya microplaca]|nr:hypothetical protein F5B20DRAFT_337598 [Whalleya microplaca]
MQTSEGHQQMVNGYANELKYQTPSRHISSNNSELILSILFLIGSRLGVCNGSCCCLVLATSCIGLRGLDSHILVLGVIIKLFFIILKLGLGLLSGPTTWLSLLHSAFLIVAIIGIAGCCTLSSL